MYSCLGDMGGGSLKMRDIKLVNHACFSFDVDGEGCLVDPWFSGSIFNNSWKLVSEGGETPDNLKYIFISHEHPDHLHWPTLKKLANSDITVILCERKNPNVENNLKRLGYTVMFVQNKTRVSLKGLNVEFIRSGHDHTIVFEHDGFVMVNQNDCKLGQHLAEDIKRRYKNIDIWWMQFSLAGYYGNIDQGELLDAANRKHRDMFISYKRIFSPKVSIPFASFVNFCRRENKTINQHRVKLKDILSENSGTQILYKGDSFLQDGFDKRNLVNIEKWENEFSKEVILEYPETTLEALQECFIKFCNQYGPQGQLEFDFFEGSGCVLNFTEKSIQLKEVTNPIAKVCLFDLAEIFKNPWGADTMNITSCFEVYKEETWRSFLMTIDGLYHR